MYPSATFVLARVKTVCWFYGMKQSNSGSHSSSPQPFM